MRINKRPLICVVICFLVLVVAYLLSTYIATSANSAAAAPSAKVMQPQSEPCLDGWHRVDSPNPDPPNPPSTLHGIAVLSNNNAWAVGHTGGGWHDDFSLIEHWDGSTWAIVPSPSPGDNNNELYDITALSTDNIWAVGASASLVEPQPPAVILHWDGNQWSVYNTPHALGRYAGLNGIDAIAPNDIWAVGSYRDGSIQGGRTLTMHWNGSQWTIVQSSNPGSAGSYLLGVSAISSNDVWAVGNYDVSQRSLLYFDHWDGHSWHFVSAPTPGYTSRLYKVKAVSSNDVWAVGQRDDVAGLVNGTLIEHWNGSQWSIVPSPNAADYDNNLTGLAVLSSNDVWAAGVSRTSSYISLAVAQHWNGSQWSLATNLTTPLYGYLYNIDAVPSSGPLGELWAVGGYSEHDTLIEHYTNPCLPPTVTPTPEPPRCPGARFSDVCPDEYFYAPVLALNDDGIVSGYSTTPPCYSSQWIPCFKPYNSSSRGQISKVVSLAAGFNEPVSGQIFEDVPFGSTFYDYVGRLANRAIISGYQCGGVGEPCVPPENRPYFRTGSSVTRGQLSKMVANSFGWSEPVTGQQFQDVPSGTTFYNYVGRLASRGIISGYPCGEQGEPCGAGNLPYFRTNNAVTRGQTAKIVQLSRPQPTLTPKR